MTEISKDRHEGSFQALMVKMRAKYDQLTYAPNFEMVEGSNKATIDKKSFNELKSGRPVCFKQSLILLNFLGQTTLKVSCGDEEMIVDIVERDINQGRYFKVKMTPVN